MNDKIERTQERILSSQQKRKADFILRNAQVADVFNLQWRKADIVVTDGIIVAIDDEGIFEATYEEDANGGYVIPGLIDGHIHIESSMLPPSEFSKILLPHGITTVITDPHEIANVAGAAGIQYMLEDAQSAEMDIYVMLPSSVPATSFENAGATLSGVETAYRVLKKKGRLTDNYKFITFGGDGGTYDIGFQSLSGAMERGHDMVYVCYDNGAYMNTGIQRSSATPKFADTTTSPAGKVLPGKMQSRKDLTKIMVSHHLPYVAQTVGYMNFKDLYEKSEKAIYTEGPTFLNVLSPCPRGWGYPTDMLMHINKLAVETCYWPLYEVVDGKYKINYKPAKKLPIEEFLRPQKRFKHLFKPGNEWMIEAFQKEVDARWQELLDLEEITNR